MRNATALAGDDLASSPFLETGPALMQAAVLAGPGTIRIERVAKPEPGPGQVRIRLEG